MRLIKDLERTRDETLGYFDLGAADLARTYGAGKWSVRYLLHHITDSEAVFYDRIRRVISEPFQVIWWYDQDAFAKGMDYAKLPLELVRPIYTSTRAAIIHHAGQFYESHGHMEFVHSKTGLRTLKDEFDKVAAHNEHHLAQIRLALKGARTGA